METKELVNKLEELQLQVEYENKKLDICGYGSSDIMYIDNLYEEINIIEEILNERRE